MTAPAGTVVAQMIGRYLPRTQTFIYELLIHMKRVRSVVVTEAIDDHGLFAFDPIELVQPVTLLERAADRVGGAVSGRRAIREKRYRAALTGIGAEIMHGHFGWSAPTCIPMRRQLGVPLVTTFYGADMSRMPEQRAWRRTYEELFEVGDAFLVEGTHMRRRLVELGCPDDKVTLQRIGVDLEKIPFRPPSVEQPEHVTVLVCGSFVEKKGIAYAIEALALARRERDDLKMLIVGDGPEKPDYQALIDRLSLGGHVRLLGMKTHAEYLALAAEAHMFMAPSVTARDGETEGGAPTVLLEMQAAGVPVLSTLHADIPEIVLDGESGLLAPERDSAALAAHILVLASDPELRKAMGARGREHMERNHDILKQAALLEQTYAKQLA